MGREAEGNEWEKNVSYGEWLRKKREEKGWSQLVLAEKSGVSQPQISNLEAERSLNPQARTRERLEKTLGAETPREVVEQAEKEEAVAGIGSLTDFDPYDEESLPDCPGVYVFYDVTDRPVYVGKAVKRAIRNRVKEHNDRFWFKRPIVDRASFIEIKDEKVCSQVEQVLIKFLKSNALFNKQHVERD